MMKYKTRPQCTPEKQTPLFDNLPPANIKKKMPQSLGPPSRPMGYNKYILSPGWKKKREKAFRLLGRKCSRCNSTVGLEVHHKTYNHLYKETSADVDILCSKCHPSADSEREIETAFGTYLSTKYGDYAHRCDEEREYEEFRDWLERKQEL